jgi:integrase
VLVGVDPHLLTVSTRRLFAKLGIKDASFHSLRHTAASWMEMKKVDLLTVSKILGHKDLRMAQRYAHLSPEYMAGAARKLNGVFARVMPEEVPGGIALLPVESPGISGTCEN